MKLRIFSNGQKYGWGKFRSLLDFFFPIGNRIRCEMTSTHDGRYAFYTFRAFVVHNFNMLFIYPFREGAKALAGKMNINPKFAYKLGAVAFDATSNGGGSSSTSRTWAHTITGTNPSLVINLWTNALGRTVTGTWNTSEATTELGHGSNGGDNYFHVRVAPTTGTHNIVMTLSGAAAFNGAMAASYTGVGQTSPFSGTNTQQTGTAQTETNTVNVSVANSWLVGCFSENDFGTGQTAGSNSFQRLYDAGNENGGLYDTNAAQTTGSKSLAATETTHATYHWVSIVAAMAPPVTAAGNTGNMLFRFF